MLYGGIVSEAAWSSGLEWLLVKQEVLGSIPAQDQMAFLLGQRR